MKKYNYLIIVLILALLISWTFLYINIYYKDNNNLPTELMPINSFADCAAAGNPVMETYPEQCRTSDGRLFIRDLSEEQPIAKPEVPTGLDSLKFSSIEASDWPYTSFQNWGLELKKVSSADSFTCEISDNLYGSAYSQKSITLNNRQYCVESKSEGAAGSVYTTYSYKTLVDDFLATVKVTVREVNCDNYDEPQQTTCKTERKTLDLDKLIDSLILVN